jgi:hypothetical protein
MTVMCKKCGGLHPPGDCPPPPSRNETRIASMLVPGAALLAAARQAPSATPTPAAPRPEWPHGTTDAALAEAIREQTRAMAENTQAVRELLAWLASRR